MTRLTRISTLVSLLPMSLVTLACGDGDDDDMMMDSSATDTSAAACGDHPAVAAMGSVCAITGGATAPITTDLRLEAGTDYLLNGPVFIGDDSAETVLTIEPGVTVFGGAGAFLLVQRGSKIMASGTAAAPIVFTSAQAVGERGPSDWGGLVINGRAPINNSDQADGSAPGEADTGRYGGMMPADSSGVLEYVRVEFAGFKVDSENELNGIAFQGVGSGTTVDYIQTHVTSDDGIEFFGGTVGVKHAVVTGSDDDGIDWTGGWTGKVQFAVVEQLAASGPDAERGIEADNLQSNNMKTPYSDPVLSNVTLISRPGNSAEGIRLRRGTRGELHNFIVTDFGGHCIRVTDLQTMTNVKDDELVVKNHVHDCALGSTADNKDPAVVNNDADPDNDVIDGGQSRDLATKAGANVVSAEPKLGAMWMPASDSPALGLGNSPSDSFFTGVDYAGAFDGTNNWAAGWIETATN